MQEIFHFRRKNISREERATVERQENLIKHNEDKQCIDAQYAWNENVLKLKNNIGQAVAFQKSVEKKLIKEVSQGHENERKSFESKMKAEYKLKKERWKKEMESQETPKSQRNQGINNFLCLQQKVVLTRQVFTAASHLTNNAAL